MALFPRRAPAPPSRDDAELLVDVRSEMVEEPPPPPEPDPDDDLPPSRMRGTEVLYGYVVAAELLVVAVLNLVIRSGPGAPTHPDTTLEIVGLVAALAFFPLILVRNRTVVGLGAIVVALFVATLPRTPRSLSIPHLLAVAVPFVYGLILTQRQRRAIGKSAARRPARDRSRRSDGSDRSRSRARSNQRRPERGRDAGGRRGRGRSQLPPPSGPRASARYTPPKAKRTGSR